MTHEVALQRALRFTAEWGVRCIVYGYRRDSGKWHYMFHPTFSAARYGPPKTTKPLVLAAAAPESKTPNPTR